MSGRGLEREHRPSLWETQKLERRNAVLSAARSLIAKKGYGNTTVDDIALSARLSAPTVYNYFGTKLDLLLALYVEDREIALRKIALIVEKDWREPLDCLLAILDADFHDEVMAVNHALWRQIVAAESTVSEGLNQDMLRMVSERYAEAVTRAFRHMILKNQLPDGADVEAAVALFVHIGEGFYRKIIFSKDKQFIHFRDDAGRQLRILVDGLDKQRSSQAPRKGRPG